MATPTVDNTGTSVTGSGVANRTITSFAVGAGSNRLLLAAASWYSDPDRTMSSVVFNTSENLTQLDVNSQNIFTGTGFQRVYFYYLKNPSNATANIVFTFSGSVGEVICGAWSLADCDLTSTFGTVAKNNTTSTANPTVTVSSSADAFVWDIVAGGDKSGAPTASGTQLWNASNAANNTRGCSQRKNGAASVTMNWTGTQVDGYVNMGVGVNGITSGGTGNPWYAYAQQ